MDVQLKKGERIELRVLSTEKQIFKKAQELSGDKSLSSFIIRIVKKHAEEIVTRNNQIVATENDRQVFFDAVFGNGKPNQNLLDAAKKYKSKSSSQ